jgi:hypothetical protein
LSWQILGADSGWQPVPLTDLITAAAVKKAYRKATLCVHPDKLQQRGATIRQKYICEKVFDLLKVCAVSSVVFRFYPSVFKIVDSVFVQRKQTLVQPIQFLAGCLEQVHLRGALGQMGGSEGASLFFASICIAILLVFSFNIGVNMQL